MFKAIVFLLSIVGTIVGSLNIAAAEDKCEEARSAANQSIDQTYLPKIDLWIKVSAAMKEKGMDPRRFPVIMPDGSIEVLDITEVIQKLITQRAAGYQQVAQAIDECNAKLAPYQKAVDIATVFITGGLSAVLPPTMTHVDASQILSGTPFGGAGALIPSLRETLLSNLGIGGDVAGMIRDPLCILKGHCS